MKSERSNEAPADEHRHVGSPTLSTNLERYCQPSISKGWDGEDPGEGCAKVCQRLSSFLSVSSLYGD